MFHSSFPYLLYSILGFVLLAFPIIFWFLKKILKDARDINKQVSHQQMLYSFNLAMDEFEQIGKEHGYDSAEAWAAKDKATALFDELTKNGLI